MVAHDATADEVILVEEYRPRSRRRFRAARAANAKPGRTSRRSRPGNSKGGTGYRAATVDHLGSYHPPGWDRYTRHAVYATDLASGEADPDEVEEITVHRVPAATAAGDLLAGRSVGWAVTSLPWAREAGRLRS